MRTTVYDYAIQATLTCVENRIPKVVIFAQNAHHGIASYIYRKKGQKQVFKKQL